MRVCVDARLRGAEATGVATYAETVVAALEGVGLTSLRLDDATQGRFGARSGPVDLARRWFRARLRIPVRLAAEGRRLHARDVFRLAQARFDRTGALLVLEAPGKPGVMHWTYPVPARIAGWTNLYTVHDVIPLTHPAMSEMPGEPLLRRLVAISASADRLITVSEASRQAIAAAMDVAPQRIINCGSAIATSERGGGTLPAGLAAGDYYIFCGMIEARKNLARIVAGWRASGSHRPFVVAGPDGDAGIDLEGVVRLGYLPRDVLLDVIAGARALLFPTLEEGFGLPVIEAMALGTPVLTSDRGALAETAGGAALGVNPTETDAIAAAIGRLDRDDALCRTLAERGLARAEDFTQAAFGRRLAALYAEFAGDLAKRP